MSIVDSAAEYERFVAIHFVHVLREQHVHPGVVTEAVQRGTERFADLLGDLPGRAVPARDRHQHRHGSRLPRSGIARLPLPTLPATRAGEDAVRRRSAAGPAIVAVTR